MKLTDTEITRRLAEGCMGWNFTAALDESGGCRFSFRLSDANEPIWSALWQPLHNEAHAAEVRERLVELGWLCVQVAGVNRLHSASLSKDKEYRDVVGATSACIAICHAALLALGLATEEEL